MALLTKIGRLFSLIAEKTFPIRAVRIVAADTGHLLSRAPRIVNFVHRVFALALDPDVRRQGRAGVGISDIAVAFSAALIAIQFGQPLVRRCMDTVAIITPPVSDRLVDDLILKIFSAVAGEAQFRRSFDQKFCRLALVCRMATAAHADPVRAMFFSAHELFSHVTFKAKCRCGFCEEALVLRIVSFMTGCALSAGDRFMILFCTRE